MPYGAAAERAGKRLILVVNAVSHIFSLSYFMMVCKYLLYTLLGFGNTA